MRGGAQFVFRKFWATCFGEEACTIIVIRTKRLVPNCLRALARNFVFIDSGPLASKTTPGQVYWYARKGCSAIVSVRWRSNSFLKILGHLLRRKSVSSCSNIRGNFVRQLSVRCGAQLVFWEFWATCCGGKACTIRVICTKRLFANCLCALARNFVL